jgi:hypothetical protein
MTEGKNFYLTFPIPEITLANLHFTPVHGHMCVCVCVCVCVHCLGIHDMHVKAYKTKQTCFALMMDD